MHYGENYWWGMPMMWFLWIPVLIILVVVIIRLLDTGRMTSRQDSPFNILKKRYARGEIAMEEYEERKRVLKNE